MQIDIEQERLIYALSNIAPLIAGIAAILSGFAFLSRGKIKFGSFQFDFERRERETILRGITDDVSRGVSPQNALMKEYHAQGLSQSKISFWFSLVFASFGFAIIAFSILLFFQININGKELIESAGKPAFMLVAGTIIDAVSALFFIQSNKSRELMVEFFDKLRIDRKLDEALLLLSQVDQPDVAARAKSIVSLNFSGVALDKSILDAMFPVETMKTPSASPHTLDITHN